MVPYAVHKWQGDRNVSISELNFSELNFKLKAGEQGDRNRKESIFSRKLSNLTLGQSFRMQSEKQNKK